MNYTKEQLEKATKDTLDDISGCCINWNYIRDGNTTKNKDVR